MANFLKKLSVTLDRRASKEDELASSSAMRGGMANSPSFNDFSLHVHQDGAF